MKLQKLLFSLLIAIGAFGCLSVSSASKNNKPVEASALSGQLYDEDMDVGINIQASSTAVADWTTSVFYVNSFEAVDVSGGNYLAFRIRSNNGAGSYFDFIPNVGGNASRVPINPLVTGIKCVPAVQGGVAFNYGGARTWDLPLNFWADADVWFCIPKSAFTRSFFGGAINWSDPIYAIYFMFYGTTNDYINFDIGNIWTVDIDSAGHLVKVKRIMNWCNAEGNGYNGVENMDKVTITRNNPTLRKAVKLIQNIEYVDSCNVSAATSAYNASISLYNSLGADGLAYLNNYTIYDYANGDSSHSKGQGTAWKASAKWAAIANITGHGANSGRMLSYEENKSSVLPFIIVSAISTLSIGALLIIKKRKAVQK